MKSLGKKAKALFAALSFTFFTLNSFGTTSALSPNGSVPCAYANNATIIRNTNPPPNIQHAVVNTERPTGSRTGGLLFNGTI